jgi:hypothetical protein
MDVAKRVPDGAESNDEKRDAAAERAARHPRIERLDNQGLSAGPDEPLVEALWGDPVNLRFPLAYREQSSPDAARSNSARSRFKGPGGASVYSRASAEAVHERIVAAQIAAGTSPSFDPDDALDAALPARHRRHMAQKAATPRGVRMRKYQEALAALKSIPAPTPTLDGVITALEAVAGLDDVAVVKAAVNKAVADLVAVKKFDMVDGVSTTATIPTGNMTPVIEPPEPAPRQTNGYVDVVTGTEDDDVILVDAVDAPMAADGWTANGAVQPPLDRSMINPQPPDLRGMVPPPPDTSAPFRLGDSVAKSALSFGSDHELARR